MKVIVLGAGVVGTTSAWYLAKAGHEVTVIDRETGPALETSFANAGQISPGYSAPWAAPGIPLKAFKWMFMKHAPLILRLRPDAAQIGWLWQMLKNCNSESYALNKGRMVRIAEYSRDCIVGLNEELGLQYDGQMRGTLEVFRSQKQMDASAKDTRVLAAGGVPFEILDRAGCVAAEPGLAASADHIVGGLRLPNDGTGDCFKFTSELAEKCVGAGVTFRWGISIDRLNTEGGKMISVATSAGEMKADAYVLALGSYSPFLAGPLGIRLPIYPLKGYSLTIPIKNANIAPESTVMDETYKVAITRLGDRIRVGGLAEVTGFDMTLREARRATLEHSVEDLFGGAGDQSQALFWTGLRPMTPDGTPIIGRTPVQGLFLNTGHGTLGWTMSAGSGQVLADIVSGQPTGIESTDLGYARYLKDGLRAAPAAGQAAAA